jgi:hypothetical protein
MPCPRLSFTAEQVHFVYEAFCRMRPGVPLAELHGKIKQVVSCSFGVLWYGMHFLLIVLSNQASQSCRPSRADLSTPCLLLNGTYPAFHDALRVRKRPKSSRHAIKSLMCLVARVCVCVCVCACVCKGSKQSSLLCVHTQEKRMYIFQDFLKRKEAVLFATDIAARGLDFPEVTACAYSLVCLCVLCFCACWTNACTYVCFVCVRA